MDIIIEGYLNRFVEEFELEEKDKDINFEKFCHYSILKNELTYFDDNDLDEVSVGKNKGIDGVCFSIDGNIVTAVQEIKDLKKQKETLMLLYIFSRLKPRQNLKIKRSQIFVTLSLIFCLKNHNTL